MLTEEEFKKLISLYYDALDLISEMNEVLVEIKHSTKNEKVDTMVAVVKLRMLEQQRLALTLRR